MSRFRSELPAGQSSSIEIMVDKVYRRNFRLSTKVNDFAAKLAAEYIQATIIIYHTIYALKAHNT